MTILHVTLAKLDESRLQGTREEAYQQIHGMMADIPIPKQEVRVGPPIDLTSTGGYTIMLSIKFDSFDDFRAYLKHPTHIKMLKRYGPALREMIAFQMDGTAPKGKL
ncbi:uncharacterized protein TRAVEDRAFT_46587 [Trametes versicolor FP-101664 SS1]|uniref:uncharacterized protein n=1 Tax=Trametes versicolor (strain FP-101664) TaxID=717944 RepID=UPI00046215FF|nr:uncharacterized protein TRAVEDRAFT_46587 [Trametes versicolor FP-101664 SS1]EIW59279.1 hypothetical protein TRAVEDRAFT_46587 [Trametes versicolor FP-101664 SS1]